MTIRILIALAGLLVMLAIIACEVEPEITVDDVDVTIDTNANPFAIESKLTPEQASGDADVLVAFGAVTQLIKDGVVSRTPGEIIGWRDLQVEIVHSTRERDDWVRVFVAYDEDFDPADLHDDKANIASCRFRYNGDWPIFVDCSRAN